jgi:D-glycero-alpha-D-manno-heptose 1-phosphate guanylyltransferase
LNSSTQITEAILLAGGFGTRLQTVVSDVPKPMAPVADKPFLFYLIQQLEKQGIKRVILSTGYKSEVITSYFAAHNFKLEILFQKEETPLGTGGGIKYAMALCQSDSVLVLNGDTYFDIDFQKLYQVFVSTQSKAALALRLVDNAGRYGQVRTNGNTIVAFEEKNSFVAEAGCINGGTYILDKPYFIKNTSHQFSIEKDFFEKEVSNEVLSGYVFKDYFIDIGIPEDYYKANEDFKAF